MNSLAIAKPHVLSVGEVNGISEMARLAAFSGFLPDDPRKPRTAEQRTADAFFVMCYGIELGIAPMTALKTIHVIDGKPACSGQALLALMRRGGVQVELPNPAEITDSATVRVKRPDSDNWSVYSYTVQMAKEAGLIGNKQNWNKFKREMLLWRAISTAARFEAPDIVGGLYTVEELSPDTQVNSDGEPTERVTYAALPAQGTPQEASEQPAQDDEFQPYIVTYEESERADANTKEGDMVCRGIAVTRKLSTNGGKHFYELALAPNPRNRTTVNVFEGKMLRENGVDTDALETNVPVSTRTNALGKPLTLLVHMRVSERNAKFWDVISMGGGEPLPHWTEFPDKRKNVVAHLAQQCQIDNLSWDDLALLAPERLPQSFESPRGLEGYAGYFIAYRKTRRAAPKHDDTPELPSDADNIPF